MTAEYFLLDEIARLLIDVGYSSTDAHLAVGLAIAKDPTDACAVEAALMKVRRARTRSRTGCHSKIGLVSCHSSSIG